MSNLVPKQEINDSGHELLSKVKQINQITDEEFTQKILDIGKDTFSTDYYKGLIRLENALENYLAKEQDLLYIGLMGTFSAGKSSTINSILRINSTEKERKTGRNPTDTNISLITHPKNDDSLITNAHQGDIQIIPVFIQNDILERLVLIDTPGSSDPRIGYDDVIDALPLCDVIFYMYNATNPFSTDDIPILELQQKYLNRIPLKFVVTRGTEFKLDKTKELSDKNFDKELYENTFIETIARMNDYFSDSEFSINDFICIDNFENYNLDRLINLINELANSREKDLHETKIKFFADKINEGKIFFEEKIKSKTSSVSDFFTQMQTNKTDFQNIISVSKANLKKDWDSALQNLKSKKEGTIHQLETVIKRITIEKSLFKIPEYKSWSEELNQSIKYFTEDRAKQIVKVVRNTITEKLNSDFYENRERKNKIDDFKLSPLRAFEYDLTLNHSLSRNYSIEKIYSILLEYIRDSKSKLQLEIEAIAKQIGKKKFSTDTKDEIEKSIVYIKEEFDKYFGAVGKYVTLVNSTATKKYMSILGLSDRFDELDIKFLSEKEKEEYKENAAKKIFNDWQDLINSNDVKSELIYEKVKKEKSECKNIDTSNIKERIYLKENDNSIPLYRNNIISIEQEYINKVKQIIEDSKIDVKRFENEKKIAFHKYEKETKKKRKIFYFKKIGIPSIIAIALCTLYYFFGHIPNPDSIQLSIIIGITINLITPLVSYIFAKRKDNFEEDIIQRKELNYIDVFEKFKENVEVGINNLKMENEYYENKISKELNDKLVKDNSDFDKSESISKLMAVYDEIVKCSENTNVLIRNYIKSFTELYNKIIPLYTNSESNLDIIRIITEEIREQSIQPSLSLLEINRTNLIDAQNRLSEL